MGKLMSDLSSYSEGSFMKAVATILFNSGFRATKNYRIAHFLYYKLHMRVLPKWLHWHNRVKYSIDLDYRSTIDGGFRIIHGVGVVIGKDVRIGKNVAVYQGVTLGGNSGKEREKDGVVFSQPWIGNNVLIYANSTVVGPVVIGNNSVVGAGSTILKDVPENSVCFSKSEIVIKANGTM